VGGAKRGEKQDEKEVLKVDTGEKKVIQDLGHCQNSKVIVCPSKEGSVYKNSFSE